MRSRLTDPLGPPGLATLALAMTVILLSGYLVFFSCATTIQHHALRRKEGVFQGRRIVADAPFTIFRRPCRAHGVSSPIVCPILGRGVHTVTDHGRPASRASNPAQAACQDEEIAISIGDFKPWGKRPLAVATGHVGPMQTT